MPVTPTKLRAVLGEDGVNELLGLIEEKALVCPPFLFVRPVCRASQDGLTNGSTG